MLPEFSTTVLQVEPLSVDLSILYPVIAEPPLSVGAVQPRLICEEETVVPASPVGGDGVAIGVVADTVFEATTLGRLVAPFRDPGVGAVSGNTKVGNRRGLIGRWQHIEYVMGFNLDRRLYDVLDDSTPYRGRPPPRPLGSGVS